MDAIITGIILGAVGILFIVLGFLLWKKEKIDLMHDYHRDKVTKENAKIYCTLCGIGMLIIGIGILSTGVIFAVTSSALSFIAFGAGFVSGLILIIHSTNKYNR